MADREKYIEILSNTAKVVKEFNEDTPIRISLESVEDILELLKEQEAVVRCKDCKYWYFADNRIPCEQENVCGRNGIVVTPDWFCADGERQEGR